MLQKKKTAKQHNHSFKSFIYCLAKINIILWLFVGCIGVVFIATSWTRENNEMECTKI